MLKILAHCRAFALLILSACAPLVPATAPPQLQHTPGPFFTITDTRVETERFRLQYPGSWRVVKLSTADDIHIQLAFVAPDQSAVIVKEVESPEAAGEDNFLELENGAVIVVEIRAADDAAAPFLEQAEQLIASIHSLHKG